ncbi:MAG: bifunctional glutamate N-acetyltransferase/amino-acid acetyltransferase ArgJ [Spirochaetota bacterium]
METSQQYPQGFSAYACNVGIKDDTLDFGVVAADKVCPAAAVFTKNNYPGAPVVVGKEHIQDGLLQAIVVNSKNANVATGFEGIRNARNMCQYIADSIGIKTEDVLPSSTGVIGVPLPIDKILATCRKVKAGLQPGNLESFAQAILTTDSRTKISVRKIATLAGQEATVYGIAKGAGMIEPNMATMLSYIFTDADTTGIDLQVELRKAVDQSFNCITIDSDTSTSDTVVVMSSGYAGKVAISNFQSALLEVCIELAKKIVEDGEGVTKVIELDIVEARDEVQASRIGKSILNSPLIKTAIHGGDPNWGRFVMAIGKVFTEKIPYENLAIQIGGTDVKDADAQVLQTLSQYLQENSEIKIKVSLGSGQVSKRFWGCNLSEGYIKENAYYTT